MLEANAQAPRTSAVTTIGFGSSSRRSLRSKRATRTVRSWMRMQHGKSAQITHVGTNGPPAGSVVATTTADAAPPTVATARARTRTSSESAATG
jgi:hypothetical protein